MLQRKIESELQRWKATPNHNPLVIKGCRQCGKTSSVLDFAQRNYPNVVYVNFYENPDYQAIFSESLQIDHLVMMLTVTLGAGTKFEPGRTVIVLDEIQECPEARTALKFFKLDGRFDVIATGSLLGVCGYGKQPKSIPVGYETHIEMHPMDFEEFLWANQVPHSAIDMLNNCLEQETPVPEALHLRIKALFLQYIVVGGMPAVVQSFVENHDMNEVLRMQKDILFSYEDDMIKYASPADKGKIRDCFRSIPRQLSKENKKFQYSLIQKGATAAKFAGSLQWIEDAGMITRCYNLFAPELPLAGNANEAIFKVYMKDSGLLIAMLEDGTQYDILHGNLGGYKGAIYENIVADMFSKIGRKLYYFHKDSGLEIDFVIRHKGQATLVEAKATTGNTKSSKTILNHPEKYHIEQVIKLGDYNIGRVGSMLTLPMYMAFLLRD